MANVITISGRQTGNKVIHLPVVSSTTTPIEVITSASGSLTITRPANFAVVSPYHSTRDPRSTPRLSTKETANNRDQSPNDDNGEVKTVYFNSDTNISREQLLLPTETFIKEEIIECEEYEEYESIDEEEMEDMEDGNSSKAQWKCSGCDKAFCYEGWLDRHKQTNPGCRDAHPIRTAQFKEPLNRPPSGKERQSLEGRLTEPLRCPNDNCDFTTLWVQSLNKHVGYSCKFKGPNGSNRLSPNSSPKMSANVCHLCNKVFSDNDQHMEHMSEVHRVQYLYQCSACKRNFSTQHESDAHIEKYHSSSPTDNGLSNGSSQCWTCESCNKSYLSLRSYQIHRTSCERGLSVPIRSPAGQRSASFSLGPKRTLTIKNSVTHFRREQIEAVHTIDFRCKFCRKLFESSNGLCNHLSRRPVCREWYYTNLPVELKKKNSLHLIPKFVHNINNNNKPKSFNRKSNSSTASSTPTRPRTGGILSRNQSNDSGGSSDQNTAQCNRCNKIFIGKNPNVALTNHQRGGACVANSRKPEVVHSRTSKTSVSGPGRVRGSQNCGENRYYCKLCPEVELKNRVSLGCHLTIYHGLPQVGVDTGKGDGFRCQTCSQVFDSKYFYNLHRQDCDLTSPYVGMITDDEMAGRKFKRSKGETCGQCGRNGFSTTTAVNIHQKYQCVKRHINKNQSNLKRFQNNQSSANRVQPIKAQKTTVCEPVPKEKPIPRAEMARLNDKAKTDPTVTMCDSCGRGPYNSYYYFMEHKKKYCTVLKGGNTEAKAKKSFPTEQSSYKSKENFCLNPTVPRARKTFTYANVNSPQISHDSSSPIDNENESEEIIVSVTEVIKCSVCPEEFEDTLAFIRHRLGHITEELTINEMVEAIDCELCGARVHHYQRIQQHLILHLQNVQIMKKKNLIEVKKKNLDLRQIASHSDDEDEDHNGSALRCPYCNSEIFSREDLAQHIRNTCPYRYQCPFCSNTYSAKESFLQHKEICSKNATIDKLASKAPTYKCRNCGLEFKIKQQLLCHELACSKVYTADHSGRVEELIERTLTCSVCGLVSDVYGNKVKHESQCIKRYLAVIGNRTEEIQSTGEETTQPIINFNLTSLSNTSESSDVPEEVINNLREEFGIKKELKVLLTGFDEDIVRRVKTDLYCERDESTQFEALKESFKTLVSRLTKNDAILFEMSQESSAEVLLQRMLKYLGEEPLQHNGLNQLNCFRQNLQLFLKLTIKDDTLVMAYKDAESVDEAIINMLNFECEFNS